MGVVFLVDDVTGDVVFLVSGNGDVVFLVVEVTRYVVFLVVSGNGDVVFPAGGLRVVVPDGISHLTLTSPSLPPGYQQFKR